MNIHLKFSDKSNLTSFLLKYTIYNRKGRIMGINKIEELNQKRFQKRQEVQIFLNNLTTITKNKKFNFNMEEIMFELTGLIDKFSRESIKISLLSEISSGKSTFLNALLFNKPILESKIGETTAKLFHIKYGEEYTIDGEVTKDIQELKTKIALENSKNLKAITEDKNIDSIQSIITLPDKNLKQGIELYDTPGFAAIKEKNIITLLKEVISQSDVTILLLDISQGIKETERLFIRNMFRNIQINKRFIVLNKYDTIVDEDDLILKSKEEINQEIKILISGIEDTLKTLQSDTSQKIESYYLSAKKALVAKVKNDSKKLEDSRFPIFEEAFWQRVVEAKDELFEDNVELFSLLQKRVQKILKEERINLQREKSSLDLKITTSSKNQRRIVELKKDIKPLIELNIHTSKKERELEIEMHKIVEDIIYILKINLASKLSSIGYFQKLQLWTLKKRYTNALLSILEEARSYIIQQTNNLITLSSRDRQEMNATLWSINKNLKELLITPEIDDKIDVEGLVDRVIVKMRENIQWNRTTFIELLKYNIFTKESKALEPPYFEIKQEILAVRKACNKAIIKRAKERKNCIILIRSEIEEMEKTMTKKELLEQERQEVITLIEKLDDWLDS